MQLDSNIPNTVTLVGLVAERLNNDNHHHLIERTSFQLKTHCLIQNDYGDIISEIQQHQILTLGKTAEIASKYLKSGSKVAIEGRLVSRLGRRNTSNQSPSDLIVAVDLLLLGNL